MNKPRKQRNSISNNKNSKVSVTKTQFYSGALPPPKMMEGYKYLDDSFPNRIITMAEKEQTHNHKIDIKEHNTIIIQASIGLFAGLLTMFFLCYLIYYSVTNNQPNVAITIVTGMAAIIGVFLYKSKRNK